MYAGAKISFCIFCSPNLPDVADSGFFIALTEKSGGTIW